MPGFTADPACLPDSPGAYLILLDLIAPMGLPPRFGDERLAPGLYVYAGSARGPGGIRARAGRHLRGDGARRWHIDWLTAAASSRRALPLTMRGECAAVQTLARDNAFAIPVPGFGNSDCPTCDAHLLRWQGKGSGDAATRAILAALFQV